MKTEIVASKTLRIGVIAAMALTVAGGIIYLFEHHGTINSFKAISQSSNIAFIGTPSYLRELSTIIPRLLQFDGAAIIQLGVIVLIATPVLRVTMSLISFVIEKDILYVIITAIVLTVILLNMTFGLH
ncbi:MAG: DUF1634 domain-containing protein [Paludibacter sp.]|nr:DUF1634 domain-containing protein [Paludibacter sp.]